MEIEHCAYWMVKRCNLAFDQMDKERRLQLKELDENFKIYMILRSKIYKEKVKCFDDNMILKNEFKVSQKVLLFNSHLKIIVDKLHSKLDGPLLFHESPTVVESDVKDLSFVLPTFLE
ncbi:hypothetical protein CR513_16185, partial [Mucuna pruriens]